jgi:ribA/ribD-fused uncharacterized protein
MSETAKKAKVTCSGKGSPPPVVLVTHASMNPVHLGHIEMMRRSKAALEAQGYRVVRGEIAITDPAWIRKKGVAPIGTAERLRLIELACATEPWLFGRDGSKYVSSKRYIAGELPRLRGVTGEPELRCADCQGSDVIMRFKSRSDIAVVACRAGDEAKLRAWQAKDATKGRPPVIVLPPAAGVLGAASSTAARAACDAGDEQRLVSICGPAVAAELLRTALGARRCGGHTQRDAPTHGPNCWIDASVPTPAQLKSRLWSTMRRVGSGRPSVVGFYGHHANKVNGCFSNFAATAFTFELPAGLLPPGSDASRFPGTIIVECSEKAIMLCKAAAFGDSGSYRQIVRAASPQIAKQLGRNVRPFDDARWQTLVCHIAREVVYQKFSKLPLLKEHLLATGSQILAEATRNDRIWGIGLNMNEDISVPERWRGTNVLGWALMQARDRLRAESGAAGASATSGKELKKPGKTLSET